MKRKTENATSHYANEMFGDFSGLDIVFARFESQQQSNFQELFRGFSKLRVLTYSNSVSIINKAAEMFEEIEIVFGREDILNGMAQYLHYQELLIRELITETQKNDFIKQKIDDGKIMLYVVQDSISHEKLFLLEGPSGTRVITGSANFSTKAFSGDQNESYICFDNDEEAWSYFSRKYEKIKINSTTSISKEAILEGNFDIENIPILSPSQDHNNTPKIIVVHDRPPTPNIIQKVIQKTPKHYEGISQVIPSSQGVFRIDRSIATRAIQYVKSNSRTEDDNPDEYLSIHLNSGRVVHSGKEMNLDVSITELQKDVELLCEYFEGYKHFRGDSEKLARDYFTFMSWFYISPLICDFRNKAIAGEKDLNHLDYPVFGILYGKSNCGKSELIRTLLLSMFSQEGFLPNSWFTKSAVANLREQNKRFPMVFDDLDRTRFNDHAIPLIKEDFTYLHEYPAIVLSMNADKDTFETEVRKRCLIIYTGASLPDHTGESRELVGKIKRIKRNLGNSLYREFLARVLTQLSEDEIPTDILKFSSTILAGIFKESSPIKTLDWCRITSIEEYSRGKHDKVKNDLLEILKYNPEAWSEKGNKIILTFNDSVEQRKLSRDIPDYLISSKSGNMIIFYKNYLEDFLEMELFPPKRKSFFGFPRSPKKH
ncbi:MAG: hypothetical protein K8L91_08925 [Anaerolineae bacterium]|nr:hypothetical protein [Anaerolineae bacterium]